MSESKLLENAAENLSENAAGSARTTDAEGTDGGTTVACATELELLQQRLSNQTQRAIDVIRITIIALSFIAAVTQLSSPNTPSPNGLAAVGSVVLVLSLGFSIIAVALNAAPILDPVDGERLQSTTVIQTYRRRTRLVGMAMVGSLVSGTFGASLTLLGAVRIAGFDPVFRLWQITPIVFFATVGVGFWAYVRLPDGDR